MASIAVWILDQVFLVVFLGAEKLFERHDLGDDFCFPVTGGIHGFDDLPGGVFLFFTGIENCRAVLRADVVALLVARGRVVHAEEFEQQVAVAEPLRVEHDFQRFGMARIAGLHLLVARVRRVAAGIADLGFSTPGICRTSSSMPQKQPPER